MSMPNQMPENRLRRNPTSYTFDGNSSSASSLKHSPQIPTSRPQANHFTFVVTDEPLDQPPYPSSMPSSPRSSKSYAPNYGSSWSERVELHHPSRITHPKPASRISGDNHTDDGKVSAGEGLISSKPKYELVFSRTLQSTERHRDPGIALSTHPSSSRMPSKPFCCPKAHCSRTFSSESALKYHSKHGYCNSLDLSQIYVSPSSVSVKLNHRRDVDGMTTGTMVASPTDILPGMFPPKHVGGNPTQSTRKGKRPRSPVYVYNEISRHTGRVNAQPTMERGRSSYRSTSLPNLHKSDPTLLPSYLTAFPPPPPFGPQKINHDKRRSPENVSSEHDIIPPKKELYKNYRDESRVRLNSYCTFGSPHLSRSLSTSRLLERDPVLGRPYSQFPSRPSSILSPSGTPSPSSFSSSHLRSPTRSFHPSPSLPNSVKDNPSSRLARPLPLPPHTEHTNGLRAAREREWGTIERPNSGRNNNPGRSNTQTSLSPRTPSPQISFRRFSRPPSPRPSSLSSSIPSFSRKSSTSSLSPSSSSPVPRYSPNSSPKISSLSSSYIRSSTSSLDPSPSPRSTHRLPIRSTQRERPLSWREKVRRGFWNRRGDFLTENGFIVYAPPDRAFPDDLATYPRETEGYQDHELEFTRYIPRPELPESLPRCGRPPERPYESFIIYVYK